ncbi:MAG: Lrp/AsnC family transcriptional regulator [Pseudomonadota bacterium]
MDVTDKRLLDQLQTDCSQNLDTIAEAVGLSRNACWRRIKALEDRGVLTGRVALADPAELNLGLTVFMAIRTVQHNKAWADRFRKAVAGLDEITGVYRMSGDTDYMIAARVPDMRAYDRLYSRLIERIDLSDVASSFVMEEIKHTTRLPTHFA